jgi:hypothetical protein
LSAQVRKVAFLGDWSDSERSVGDLVLAPIREADMVLVSSLAVLLDPPLRLLEPCIFIVGLALPVVTKHAWHGAKACTQHLGRHAIIGHAAIVKKTVVTFAATLAADHRPLLKAFQSVSRRNRHIEAVVSPAKPSGCPESSYFDTTAKVKSWLLANRRVTNYLGRRLVTSQDYGSFVSGVDF